MPGTWPNGGKLEKGELRESGGAGGLEGMRRAGGNVVVLQDPIAR